MNTLQKLRKNKKGFTLVELLVVLVIMAILAAAIIPSMMGFIDKAKEESVAAECRSVLLATDVEINEYYGLDKTCESGALAAFVTAVTNTADIPTDTTINSITLSGDTKGASTHPTVTAISYNASNGYVYTYAGSTDTWTKGAAY